MLRRGGTDLSEDDAGESQPLLPKVPNRRATFGSATFRSASDLEAAESGPNQRSSASGYPAELHNDLRSSMESQQSQHWETDVRRAFVLSLMDRPELSDKRIDRDSLKKGQRNLLEALDGRMTDDVQEDLPNLFIFKGRPLVSACVLHLAVWCSSRLLEASLLELVLKCLNRQEFQFQAKYELPSRKDGWTCELRMDALHIAAGLGCLPAVELLVQHALACAGAGATRAASSSPASLYGMTPSSNKVNKYTQDYVNQYTVKFHRKASDPLDTKSETFYCPIHEATAQGFLDVALYLLYWGADGSAPNADGVTPLHFLAMQGCTGGLLTGMHTNEQNSVRALVLALQDAGGSLEARVPSNHFNAKWAGSTPLQLAATDDSRFPRQMMGLLVPCLQDDSVAEPRFFVDVVFLTALDSEAATGVVQEIASRASRNTAILQRFRIDAQKSGRTDLLASILFLAPEAGGCMLEMLVGDPIVKDVSKHNIPTRTSLYGFWRHLPMRCIYRGDAERRDGIVLPVWSFQTDRPLEEQRNIRWHRWLVPETEGLAKRTDHLYNISVSVVLLPNVLDLDMFMGLARVQRQHMKVFSKLPIQAMIYCLWSNLVQGIWLTGGGGGAAGPQRPHRRRSPDRGVLQHRDLLFHLLELIVLMWWSLSWPMYGPRSSVRSNEPLFWAVITAGCIREATQAACVIRAAQLKFHGHTDLTMRSMWHPFSDMMLHTLCGKILIVVAQSRFVYSSRNSLDERDFSSEDQVLLAVIVLMKAAQVTYSCRLCSGGSKIYAIFYSFFGGATREVISVTAMIFGSFSLAFMVLAKDKSAGWVVASSYRGLLFGDGEAFGNLGMDIHESGFEGNDGVLMFFLVVGSLFFNIILLNLIIAVYGNEYDKVAGETPLLFLHGRARSCVSYILSCQVVPWYGENFNSFLCLLSLILALAGVWSHLTIRRTEQTWELTTAVLFAAAQVLFMAAQAQVAWYSIEGIAADQEDHFLWICHRDNIEETNTGNELLQVGCFEDRLLEHRRHVDKKIASMESKLDTILELLQAGR